MSRDREVEMLNAAILVVACAFWAVLGAALIIDGVAVDGAAAIVVGAAIVLAAGVAYLVLRRASGGSGARP